MENPCRRSWRNSPANITALAFVDQYIGNLKQYRAIAMGDVGDQDGLRFDATKLREILDRLIWRSQTVSGIYSGTCPPSAVADRFQNHVMPFFSKNLCFTDGCR